VPRGGGINGKLQRVFRETHCDDVTHIGLHDKINKIKFTEENILEELAYMLPLK